MENVWGYPRPPRLERCHKEIIIEFAKTKIARTHEAYRVLETSHPPVYYLPPSAFLEGVLRPASDSSFCEWKGRARYWDIVANGRTAPRAGWSYPDLTPAFADIQDYVAIYAAAMDACYVDGERVTPQPGGFYGGWITKDLVGPFKGEPGSAGW